MALQIRREIIDKYCNIMTQTTFSKPVVITGHSGSGETFYMLYIDLYNISKLFYSTDTSMMRHSSFQMGTQRWRSILCLRGNKDNVKIRIVVHILLLEELEGRQ